MIYLCTYIAELTELERNNSEKNFCHFVFCSLLNAVTMCLSCAPIAIKIHMHKQDQSVAVYTYTLPI